MKYTNYILSKKLINIEAIQTKNPVLAVPMVTIGVPIVILGLLTILFTLPAAITMDQQRKVKYFLIIFKRKYNYQYGSQTHISNLCRDYIRIPYWIFMGFFFQQRRHVRARETIWRNGLPVMGRPHHVDRIYPDMGRNFLVVNDITNNREYG